jgi:hypothetical protein
MVDDFLGRKITGFIAVFMSTWLANGSLIASELDRTRQRGLMTVTVSTASLEFDTYRTENGAGLNAYGT